MIRILPTKEGQKSLYEYAQVGGKRYAAWCVAYEPKSGWPHFCSYLKLNAINGLENIKREYKNPPQSVIDNPMYSFYYVAKDGLPWAAFEFRSNYFMNIQDTENRTHPDYNEYIKPMIMKYLPFARNIVEPAGISRTPSTMLKEYIRERPKELAASIVCRLKNIASINQKNPFVDIKDKQSANASAIEICQQLNIVLQEAFLQKDEAWRDGLSTWARYSTTKPKQPKNNQTSNLNTNVTGKINIDTPEVRRALIHYLLEPDINCSEMINMNLKFKDALEQRILDIETKKMQEMDENIGEGVISKTLGTAAVIGALGVGMSSSTSAQRMNNTSSSQILNQNRQIQHNIITRTLWAEARNDGEDGMREIANTIYNRSGGDVNKMIEVIKKPKHYSCWNKMTPKDWNNFKIRYRSGPEWNIASEIAHELINGEFKKTSVADHYYNPVKAKPSWAYENGKLRPHYTIGKHRFMNINKKRGN